MANKNKATHYGECQVCGCRQKLPNGKLSLHGYTKRWGFFEGTCCGANELPFELSKDLIEGAIRSARRQAKALREQASHVLKSTDSDNVQCECYVTGNHRTGNGYKILSGKLEERIRKSTASDYTWVETWFVHTYVNGTKEECQIRYVNSLEEAVAQLNQKESERLLKVASQYDSYVKWQTSRIKNWAPKELTPVEAPVEKTAEEKALLEGGAYWVGRASRYMGGRNRKGWWYYDTSTSLLRFLGESATTALERLQTAKASV